MVIAALYWLAYSQNKLKRPEEAAVSITECLRLRRKIFSSGHVTITESENKIDILCLYYFERVYTCIYLVYMQL